MGLQFKPGIKDSLQKTADDIAGYWEHTSFSREPTFGNWALIATSGDNPPFDNAAFFSGHCYDGVDASNFARIITEIVQLAGNEWLFDSVTVEDAKNPIGPLRDMEPVNIVIHGSREVAPFTLKNAKDLIGCS